MNWIQTPVSDWPHRGWADKASCDITIHEEMCNLAYRNPCAIALVHEQELYYGPNGTKVNRSVVALFRVQGTADAH